MRYPVVLHKDPGSDWGVIVPDLPGCFSAGTTIEEALESAKEAVEGHLEVLIEGGDSTPDLAPIEDHVINPDYTGGVWFFVDIDSVELLGKTDQYNLTMPARLVDLADDYWKKHQYRSRSDFFTKLAAKELGIDLQS